MQNVRCTLLWSSGLGNHDSVEDDNQTSCGLFTETDYEWVQLNLVLYNVSVWCVRLYDHWWGIWLNHLFQSLFLSFLRRSPVTHRMPKLLNMASLRPLPLSPTQYSSSLFLPLWSHHFSCPPGLSHLYVVSATSLVVWSLIFTNATQVTSFSITSLIRTSSPHLKVASSSCSHTSYLSPYYALV